MNLLEKAIEAAIKAGKVILKIYNQYEFKVEYKEDSSPLTAADLESHKIITNILAETRIPILSEEDKNVDFKIRKEWETFWLVDPLDGTKEFIKKNDEFTVNIALIENNYPVLGVIFVPVTGELYYATATTGSFKTIVDEETKIDNVIINSEKLPVKYIYDHYTLVVSRSHMNRETEAFINKIKKEKGKVETISRGSSLKICMIAEGKADCYPRFAPTMEWDTAAGHAIAKFAGKTVRTIGTGEELTYNKEDMLNPNFIVE